MLVSILLGLLGALVIVTTIYLVLATLWIAAKSRKAGAGLRAIRRDDPTPMPGRTSTISIAANR
jgi:hypothetical protein